MVHCSLIKSDIMARNASAALTCGNSGNAVPFLRDFIPSLNFHYHSTSVAEMEADIRDHAAEPEGEIGYMFTTQELGTVTLYRMHVIGSYQRYYTISSTPPVGYVFEAIAGYVYPTQICGSVPLYQIFKSSISDHLCTISKVEANMRIGLMGYTNPEIVAYVLPSGGIGCGI